MARNFYLAFLLLALSHLISAEYGITDNAAYATAGTCAQYCAAYMYGYWGYLLCGDFSADASCLCGTPAYSSTMDVELSECPTVSRCGGEPEATKGMAIFSAYCSKNLKGAAVATTTQASTARTSNPAAPATPGASVSDQQGAPASSQTSTSSDQASSGNNGLSTSDKIAIGCAIGGAIVTIAVAVPTWLTLKRRRRRENAAASQPLRGPPPMVNAPYGNPMQQPFLPQPQPQPPPYPYRNQGYSGWQGWR